MRCATVIAVCLLFLAHGGSATAQAREVDLELVLMVDVSRSMTPDELELQRRGYAEALQSEAVFQAVQSGLLQSVALTYVEWAGSQEIIVDWQILQTRADFATFAKQLTVAFNPGLRRTSISGALAFGADRILGNTITGLRRVIDISGDGPNNMGPFVTQARDRVLAQGITINGLPLMISEGSDAFWHLDNLDYYYETCVIGGPGAFVIPVKTWTDFAAAVRRKLVLEIADAAPPARIIKAQVLRDPSDCQVGEKIWEDWRGRRQQFYLP